MWEKALNLILRRLLREGKLEVRYPIGQICLYGDGTGNPVRVRLLDMATLRRLVANPELALGEAYMNATLTIGQDDLQEFLGLVVHNRGGASRVFWQRLIQRTRLALPRFSQHNAVLRSRRSVIHHSDLSDKLYKLFLDADRQHSYGYFRNPDDTLEQAQENKQHHIAHKLCIEKGMRVLDIGCGWGGMARDYGALVLGITLSEQQLTYAIEATHRENLSDRVRFQLCDYRNVTGTFDRIVSVGMLEHVGLPNFIRYFQSIRDRLAPHGIALVHTIGWTGPPDATNPWIAKYIFPGGYVPTMSEVMKSVEYAHIWPEDVEVWRLHYAETLRNWFDRFTANEDRIRDFYDPRFVRMWRFYLAACEQTFRYGPQAVFRFQLSRRIDAVLITRHYLYSGAPDADTLQVLRPRQKRA